MRFLPRHSASRSPHHVRGGTLSACGVAAAMVGMAWWSIAPHRKAPGPDPPLHAAAAAGDVARVRQILDRNPGAVRDRTSSGETALHRAATAGQVQALRLLLARGADACVANDDGRTPLHLAVVRRDAASEAIVAELLPHYRTPDVPDALGWTPLHLACQAGNEPVVRRLLAAGANVNAREGDGKTPLHIAAAVDRPAVIQVLLAAGAAPGARDKSGATPLATATRCNSRRAAEALRRVGAQ